MLRVLTQPGSISDESVFIGLRLKNAVDSTGERNTLIFEQRWSVHYEVSSPY